MLMMFWTSVEDKRGKVKKSEITLIVSCITEGVNALISTFSLTIQFCPVPAIYVWQPEIRLSVWYV